MKTIGISLDRYKLDKYIQELADIGLFGERISISNLPHKIKLIKIVCTPYEINIIQDLCIRLESEFKAKLN